jgi:hypothetical protein
LLCDQFGNGLVTAAGHAELSLLFLTRVVYHLAYFSSKMALPGASAAQADMRICPEKRYFAQDSRSATRMPVFEP